MEISSQETGLDRKWASGIPQYSCAQLAMAVTSKCIHHTRGRHKCQRVVPGKGEKTAARFSIKMDRTRPAYIEIISLVFIDEMEPIQWQKTVSLMSMLEFTKNKKHTVTEHPSETL